MSETEQYQKDIQAREILPAFLEGDFDSIRQKAQPFAGIASVIQIDICDGIYTTSATWPFSQNTKPAVSEWARIDELRQQGLLVEFDLMIQNPEQYIVQILSANPRRVVIHLASTQNIAHILSILHGYQMEYPKFQYGIAFTRDISEADIKKYIRQCDFVQVMGIMTIGVQGQDFDDTVIGQIQHIHTQHPLNTIQIDGAISETTLVLLKDSGIERFVVGSALSGLNPVEMYYTLQDILK